VEKGANCKKKRKDGNTALELAKAFKQKEVTDYLATVTPKKRFGLF